MWIMRLPAAVGNLKTINEVVVVLDDVRVLQHRQHLHLVDGGESVEAAQLLHWDLTTKVKLNYCYQD